MGIFKEDNVPFRGMELDEVDAIVESFNVIKDPTSSKKEKAFNEFFLIKIREEMEKDEMYEMLADLKMLHAMHSIEYKNSVEEEFKKYGFK